MLKLLMPYLHKGMLYRQAPFFSCMRGGMYDFYWVKSDNMVIVVAWILPMNVLSSANVQTTFEFKRFFIWRDLGPSLCHPPVEPKPRHLP